MMHEGVKSCFLPFIRPSVSAIAHRAAPAGPIQKARLDSFALSPCLPGSSSRLFHNAHQHGFLTTAACGSLGSAPDRRARRALLHLWYICAASFGPAMLVKHDPQRKFRVRTVKPHAPLLETQSDNKMKFSTELFSTH